MLYREMPIVAHDTAARTVTVQLTAWNSPREVIEEDGTRYNEAYAPGSVELAPSVHVVDRHKGSLIGRADPESFTETDDGPTVDLVVARSVQGNDVMALVDAGVIRAVSMEVEDVPGGATFDRAQNLVTRTRAIVHGIAFAFRPQLDAPILAVRSLPETENPMTVIDTPSVPSTEVVVQTVTPDLLERSLSLFRDEIRRDALAAVPGDPGHPLTRFRSLDEYTEAAYADPSLRGLLHRALADQVTGNNPGVMPPGWVKTVYGIVDRGRPVISAFGTAPLPPSGMDVNWPYFDGDLMTLVGAQAAQKTAITSVRVDIKKGSEALVTLAGGSDISYQLIRRSDPSYRDAYMRIMFAAYAAVSDATASIAAEADAATHVPYDIAADTDGNGLRAALFAASVAVESATGAPASFVLAATDAFLLIGAKPGLFPTQYGTQNASGTADASSLAISISGLPVIHAPYLPAGTILVSNSLAGDWYEDGPMTVAAEDVEKLGQNVAVWGMGAFATALPKGIAYLSPLVRSGTTSARGNKKSDA